MLDDLSYYKLEFVKRGFFFFFFFFLKGVKLNDVNDHNRNYSTDNTGIDNCENVFR